MKDPYGRPLNSIRISVTRKCNLRCRYCHNEGQPRVSEEMTPEEIEKILIVAGGLGVEKVKFTGGEPLVRKDIADVIRRASDQMEEVSLTTNGTLLAPAAAELAEAGLARVNVSLDSLNAELYRRITGKDMLARVLKGIRSAVEAGLYPVKVNIVVLADSSREDLFNTIERVWALGGRPQVIEVLGACGKARDNIDDLEKEIASAAVKVRERSMQKRKIYVIEEENGGGGSERTITRKKVEFVRPMHNTRFCGNCTRIRVTSGGMLKPCLMHNEGLVDILTPVREGAAPEELREIFARAVYNRKPYWK